LTHQILLDKRRSSADDVNFDSGPFTTSPLSSAAPTPLPTPPTDAAADDEIGPSSLTIDEAINSPLFELFSCSLVLLSSLSYAILTIPNLPAGEISALTQLETCISIFFFVEYILRWREQNFRPSFVAEPLSLIDLVSFLPTLAVFVLAASVGLSPLSMPPSDTLSFLRLLRILRLQRFVSDFDSFAKLELALGLSPSSIKKSQLQFARVFISLLTLLFISTGLIYTFEHVTNPQIPDFFTALYFGLCTLTTVGFGDIVPVTFAGRLVVCGSILVGIGVIPLQVGELAEALLGSGDEEELRAEIEKDERLIEEARKAELEWRGRYEEMQGKYEELMKEVEILRRGSGIGE